MEGGVVGDEGRWRGIAVAAGPGGEPGIECRSGTGGAGESAGAADDDKGPRRAESRAGASGFLLKDVSPADLVHGIRTIVAGDALLAPAIVRRLVDQYVARPMPTAAPSGRLAALTERELDVLTRLARGLSNAEIAAELYLSAATIKTHVARILAKLGVRDRIHAVITAYETGLITPGST